MRLPYLLLLTLFFNSTPGWADSPLLKGNVKRTWSGEAPGEQSGQASEQSELSGAQTGLNGSTEQQTLPGNAESQGLSGRTADIQMRAGLQGRAVREDETYGVLGAKIASQTGVFITIYPQSDLNRFDVRVGDRVVGIEGHRYRGQTFPQECLGAPGTTIKLDILSSQTRTLNTIEVRRVDSRELSVVHKYYRDIGKNSRGY